MRSLELSVGLALVLSMVACGGGAPPAKSGGDATPPAPSSAPAPAPTTTEPAPAPAEEPAASSEPAPTPPPADSGEKPSRPPVDTVTAPKVAYLINYSSSAPSEAADKKCSAAAGGDPAVKAACMKKERSEFMADVIRFKKDAQEKVWFTTYRRRGSTLVVLHKTPVKVSNDGDAAMKVEILGDDKATRLLFPRAKTFKIGVPNDYSIEIDEPRYGKLVYDAKVDLVGN